MHKLKTGLKFATFWMFPERFYRLFVLHCNVLLALRFSPCGKLAMSKLLPDINYYKVKCRIMRPFLDRVYVKISAVHERVERA